MEKKDSGAMTAEHLRVPRWIEQVLERFVEEVLAAYHQHVKRIILFGSYARGDFQTDSDIDIMVLVDYEREEISEDSRLSDISFDIGYENDVEINPLIQNVHFFDQWIGAYPFYNHVINEGVQLYAA